MIIISALWSIFLTLSSAWTNENIYISSTPADPIVRSFLGIPLSDSVDFLRWKVSIKNNRYQLQCNYGIGQPNTNGFISGGKKIEITGESRKENNYYLFQNGTRTLKFLVLNSDLLHLLNADNSLMVGNGGWSYTFNSVEPSGTDHINITSSPTIFKDSIAFVGRTPCGVPGVVEPGRLCYKIKWHIILYANAHKKYAGVFKIYGTPWRGEGSKTGNWKIVTRSKGGTMYQLDHQKGGSLYLLKLDDHILVFTDAQGKLLVGDEDFSYTLNSR